MTDNTVFLWLAMMVPLIFSAGPANITMASLGARFGFLRALPFICGINLMVLVQALLIGFGAGRFLQLYPGLFRYLQYAGALYLIYLASKFFRLPRLPAHDGPGRVPNFLDGVILQMLNMKVVTVTMVMFAQFLDKGSDPVFRVIWLASGLAGLTTCATLAWAAGGAVLIGRLASGNSARAQGIVFGSMLIGVSFWMLLSTG